MLELRDTTLINTKVIELQQLILAAQEQALKMQDERLELLDKVKRLEEEAKKQKDVDGLYWERPYYFVIDDEEKKDGPFCQSCYDATKKLIRLQGGNNGTWSCKTCKSRFYDSAYVPPTFAR